MLLSVGLLGARFLVLNTRGVVMGPRVSRALSEPKHIPKLVFHHVKLGPCQLADLADDHLLFDRPNDAGHRGGKQQACLAPGRGPAISSP